MRLEDSDGKILDPVTEAEMNTLLEKVGGSLDFCILSDGDDFIQTAASDGGLLIEYKDSSGHFEGDDTSLSVDTVKKIFSAYLSKDESWKTAVSFSGQKADYNPGNGPASNRDARLNSGPKDFTVDSIKDTVVRAVKDEAGRGVSRMIRKFIRNIFR